MNSLFNTKSLPFIAIALVAITMGYYFLNAPDRRDPAEKIGDAIQELGNRTPGEKTKDAVTDVTGVRIPQGAPIVSRA